MKSDAEQYLKVQRHNGYPQFYIRKPFTDVWFEVSKVEYEFVRFSTRKKERNIYKIIGWATLLFLIIMIIIYLFL